MGYPYLSEKTCKKCGDYILIKQKRDKNNSYCSRFCYNADRRKSIKINLRTGQNICLKCGKGFIPGRNTLGMYCSYACSNGAKSVRYQLVCKSCGKEFEINNIAEIKRGHYQYCSNECRKRKYKINELFFDKIDERSCYWMGFIWATSYQNKYNKLYLLSKSDLLERFNNDIDSTYPIKKSTNGKYTLKITSLKIINRLSEFGLRSDIYSEFPTIPEEYYKDFIRGYFDSDRGFLYKDIGKNVVSIHGDKAKVIRFISDYINSKLVFDKNESVSISFDFYEKINGYPRLEEKWEKFS